MSSIRAWSLALAANCLIGTLGCATPPRSHAEWVQQQLDERGCTEGRYCACLLEVASENEVVIILTESEEARGIMGAMAAISAAEPVCAEPTG